MRVPVGAGSWSSVAAALSTTRASISSIIILRACNYHLDRRWHRLIGRVRSSPTSCLRCTGPHFAIGTTATACVAAAPGASTLKLAHTVASTRLLMLAQFIRHLAGAPSPAIALSAPAPPKSTHPSHATAVGCDISSTYRYTRRSLRQKAPGCVLPQQVQP